MRYNCFIFLFASAFLLLGAGRVSAQSANFTASPKSGCSPLVVTFTNTSTGTITSHKWEFGDTKTSVLKDPSTTYTDPGTYIVKLTVTNSATGSSNVKTDTIRVYPSPTVNFTATPLKICPCDEVSFTNTSVPNAPGGITSIWSFGDGYTSTSNNTTHAYCTPGIYDVAVKVTNSVGCVSTKAVSKMIEVFEKPDVTFDASKTSLCKVPDSTKFTAYITKGKAPYTYSWDFGDGIGTSVLPSPTYKYTLPGTYTVKLYITDANGCKDTAIRVNYINASPMNSDFVLPASVCASGQAVMFTNASVPTPVSTRWIWSDGGGSSGKTPVRTYYKGGTYGITMIDSFGPGCKDTAYKTYTVHPKPAARFSYWPIYPCPAPVDVHFQNTSRGADSFLWVFGDGTSSKLKSPVHTYTWDSIFTVYLIAKTDMGCLDTFRVRDTTKDFPLGYPSPLYDSSNSPVIIRVYNMMTKWVVSPAPDPNRCIPWTCRFSCSMMTDVNLPSVIDTPNCGLIEGYAAPYWKCSNPDLGLHLDAYPDEYVDPPIPMEPLHAYPYPARSYYWEFGDGGTSTDANPYYTYTVEGEYKVKVRITTDSCVFYDSTMVSAGERPTANFTMDPDTICKGGIVTFKNLSSANSLRHIWDFGDSKWLEDSTKEVRHEYRVSGERRVTLTVERYGCTDTISKLLVINPPSSRFGIKYSCDTPLKVRFLDSSYRASRVKWNFGDGDTSLLRDPIHMYSDTGTYKVVLYTYNDTFGCFDTSERMVYLYYQKPHFTTADSTLCLGDTAVFTISPRNYLLKYTWKTSQDVFYDGFRDAFCVYYPDTGIYTITLYSENTHECADSFVRQNHIVVAKPFVKIKSDPLIACFPVDFKFTDSSVNVRTVKNITRTWMWGDATSKTDTARTATKSYTAPGSYSVRLIVTDNFGCKDSANLSVESRKPVAAFAADVDTFTCIGRNIKFYSASTGTALKHYWDFGDGNTSTLTDPTHRYSTLGTFTVKLLVVDNTGCRDSVIKTAYIITTAPDADFTMKDSISLCPPLFVQFNNASSPDAVRVVWDFDNGSNSFAPDPVAPFIDSGIYYVQLVAFNKYGCTDTAIKRVRVLGYDGLLKYSPLLGCAPLTVNFEADLINADVMVWDFADGYTENALGRPITTHTYATPGKYVPRLILGDGKGCSTSSKGLDTIYVDDVTAKLSLSPACEGAEIIFNDSSYSYFSTYQGSEWVFHDGSTSTSKNPRRWYSTAGTYPVTLVTTNTNGCKDTLQANVVIHKNPKVVAKDTTICRGDQAALEASGALTYVWMTDPTLSCSECPSPVTSAVVATRYFVTGTDENGCKNTDTLDLKIKTKTVLTLAKDAEVCQGTVLLLSASGAQNYSWTPPTYLDRTDIPAPSATITEPMVIEYQVIGTEGSCIPDTASIKVTVHPRPVVNAGPDQKVLAGTQVQLSGSATHVKDYRWTPSDSLSCADCPNPMVRPYATTTYTLKALSDYGCSDSDDVTIVVFCDQSQLFIPNTFTPNGDGQNDYFFPQGNGVSKIKSMIIYNRWGQKVYEKTNFDVNVREQGWDGTLNGSELSPDTYVYVIEANCDNGEVVFWKGDVTIIK